jgi:colanic acid/amylovoran biosynthesis glycosyltransferase
MENVNLVVMSPLKAVSQPGGRLLLTRKFVDGMELYKELWKGPITLLCEPADVESDNLDNVEIDPERLSFKTICQPYSQERLLRLLDKPSIVLASEGRQFNFVSTTCRLANTPCVYVTEQSLKTRLQILIAEQRSLLRRVVRSARELRQQTAQNRAISLADGVQCNGTPTYETYNALTPSPLLFFDTRTEERMLTTPQKLEGRTSSLGRRPIHLVFSGRLHPIKGVDHLPLVANHLRKAGVSFKMSICGDGECMPQLVSAVKELDLEAFVFLRGMLNFRDELLPFVSEQTDLFVCCHRQGDPSCTYLETMGCGVPIIGYANEAFAGLAAIAGTGWITPMNKPAALAAKIASLRPDDLKNSAEKALSFARDNTFEKTFRRRIDHLNSVVTARMH